MKESTSPPIQRRSRCPNQFSNSKTAFSPSIFLSPLTRRTFKPIADASRFLEKNSFSFPTTCVPTDKYPPSFLPPSFTKPPAKPVQHSSPRRRSNQGAFRHPPGIDTEIALRRLSPRHSRKHPSFGAAGRPAQRVRASLRETELYGVSNAQHADFRPEQRAVVL